MRKKLEILVSVMSRSKCRTFQEKASPAPDKAAPLTRNKGARVIGFNGDRSVRSIRTKVGLFFSLCRSLWNLNLLAHCHREILKTWGYKQSFMPRSPLYIVLFKRFYASWMFIPSNQTTMWYYRSLWWYPSHQLIQETRVILGNKT